MKKSELKDGMIVVYRNGTTRIVRNDVLLDDHFRQANKLVSYDDSLLSKYMRCNDIVKVMQPETVLFDRSAVSTYEQKEIEDIRKEMDKLSVRLKELEG